VYVIWLMLRSGCGIFRDANFSGFAFKQCCGRRSAGNATLELDANFDGEIQVSEKGDW